MCPNQHWVGSKHIFNLIVHTYVSKSQQTDLEFSVPQDSICGPVLIPLMLVLYSILLNTPGSQFLVMPTLHSFNAKIFDVENSMIKNLETFC